MRNQPVRKASHGGQGHFYGACVSFAEVMIRLLFGVNMVSNNGLLNFMNMKTTFEGTLMNLNLRNKNIMMVSDSKRLHVK